MNKEIFYFFNSFACKNIWLDRLFLFFGDYVAYILPFVAVIFLFLINDKKEKIKFLILSLTSVFLARGIITEVVRYFYHHPRPFVELSGVCQLIAHETSYSLPSGHVVAFFALATSVYFFNKKRGLVFAVVVFLMGVARVVSGIHWPADILAGAIIGIISAWVVKAALDKYHKIS